MAGRRNQAGGREKTGRAEEFLAAYAKEAATTQRNFEVSLRC